MSVLPLFEKKHTFDQQRRNCWRWRPYVVLAAVLAVALAAALAVILAVVLVVAVLTRDGMDDTETMATQR